MRIDKYLKVSRLVKRRVMAHDLCEAGKVSVNQKVVKPGYEVHVGDRIRLELPMGVREVEVVMIKEHVSADQAVSLYREV